MQRTRCATTPYRHRRPCCMCGRPLERKGFCMVWLTERVRSCVRPLTRLHDRWPRWASPNKPQTWRRHRDALATSGVSCSSVRPFAISYGCPFAPRRRRTIRWLVVCAGKPCRSPSCPPLAFQPIEADRLEPLPASPTRCGLSCWPEQPRPLCVAGAPAIAAARGLLSCSARHRHGVRP